MGKSTRKLQAKKEKNKLGQLVRSDAENVQAFVSTSSGFEHLLMDPTMRSRLIFLEKWESCKVCGQKTPMWCYMCMEIAYCSQKCQDDDENRHFGPDGDCVSKPGVEITVNHNDWTAVLRTTKDFQSGQTLFFERGLFWLPSPRIMTEQNFGSEAPAAVCYGCHKIFSSFERYYPCTKCGLSLCGTECELVGHHPDFECRVIQEIKMAMTHKGKLDKRFTIGSDPVKQYMDVCIIRVLVYFRNKQNLPKWLDLNTLTLTPKYQKMKELDASILDVDSTYSQCILSRSYTKNCLPLVQRIYDLILLFMDDVYFKNSYHGQIFLFKSAMQQSCSPNVIRMELGQPASIDYCDPFHRQPMAVKAITNMKKGTVVTFNFNDTMNPFSTTHSRTELMDGSYVCHCKRCEDPTECSTYAGSIRCSLCKNGMYVDTFKECSDPQKSSVKIKWTCDTCDHSTSFKNINHLITSIENECFRIIRENRKVDLIKMEQSLIEELQNGRYLHASHALILSRKYMYLTLCYKKDMWQFRIEVEKCFDDELPEDLVEWIKYVVTPFPMQWNVEILKELYKRFEYAKDCLEYLKRTVFLKKEIAMTALLINFNLYAKLDFKVVPSKMAKIICTAHMYSKDALKDYETFFIGNGKIDLLFVLLQKQTIAFEKLGRLGESDVKKTAEILARQYLGIQLTDFALDFGMIEPSASFSDGVTSGPGESNNETVSELVTKLTLSEDSEDRMIIPEPFNGIVDPTLGIEAIEKRLTEIPYYF